MYRRTVRSLSWLALAALGIAGLPQTVSAQQHTVTKVVVVAKPKAYTGPCPTELQFIGTIFVSRHPVMVEYQWERSDGAKGERKRIEIRSVGQGVRETWTLGASRQRYRVWERLHVLTPTGISAQSPVVSVACR